MATMARLIAALFQVLGVLIAIPGAILLLVGVACWLPAEALDDADARKRQARND